VFKKFNQYIKDLISDRTEEIGRKILYNNKRYRELNLRIIEVQQALTKNLPPQAHSLVNYYDEAEAEQDSILTITMYRQGFMDGVNSTKLLTRYEIMHRFFSK
jgi:hypothetical protein